MIINTKLFVLEAVALPGRSTGLKVKCKNPGCTRQCTLTFKTLKGFSSVSGAKLENVYSLLCRELEKEKESAVNVITQISLT